jgi:PKD repeat protein
MKIRFPKIRKKILLTGLLCLALAILGIAAYFYLLPALKGAPYIYELKAVPVPVQALDGADAGLAGSLAKPLIADFSAVPDHAFNPLEVGFFDESRGDPTSWAWDFGDNQTSALQNPIHTYDRLAIYNATLTVTRADGAAKSFMMQDVLGVTRQAGISITLDTLRQGVLKKGSFVSFVSANGSSSVTVNGAAVTLPEGSVVKMRVNSNISSGALTFRHGNLLGCSLADATLFVNGNEVGEGSIGNCNLPVAQAYHANLSFGIRPFMGNIRQLTLNGSKVLAGEENSYLSIHTDTTDQGGDLTLTTIPGYFEGYATRFSASPAVIAAFDTVSSHEGPAPLNVSFLDRSAGNPASWHWDFGDGTGADQQNPTHLYKTAGSYTVSLTVVNEEQTDSVTRENAVVVTPPTISADFSAEPREGPAPLTVRLTDLSTGSPVAWNWQVSYDSGYSVTSMGQDSRYLVTVPNPMETSTEQNPVITLPYVGSYTIWLSVANVYGSSDQYKSRYITVADPYGIPDKSIFINTGKPGYIEKNSSMQFVVRDTPAAITINGAYRELPKSAVIRIVAMSDQTGDITIQDHRILKFSFPDMAVYINGKLSSVGRIDNIYIPSVERFDTDLTYYLEPNTAWTKVTINGYDVLSNLDNAWIRVYSLGMDSTGSLSLISTSNSTYIEGAANRTVQDWIIQ